VALRVPDELGRGWRPHLLDEVFRVDVGVARRPRRALDDADPSVYVAEDELLADVGVPLEAPRDDVGRADPKPESRHGAHPTEGASAAAEFVEFGAALSAARDATKRARRYVARRSVCGATSGRPLDVRESRYE